MLRQLHFKHRETDGPRLPILWAVPGSDNKYMPLLGHNSTMVVTLQNHSGIPAVLHVSRGMPLLGKRWWWGCTSCLRSLRWCMFRANVAYVVDDTIVGLVVVGEAGVPYLAHCRG